MLSLGVMTVLDNVLASMVYASCKEESRESMQITKDLFTGLVTPKPTVTEDSLELVHILSVATSQQASPDTVEIPIDDLCDKP